MTVAETRDKYQDFVNAESAMIQHSPFRLQIIQSAEERYIRYHTICNAMIAFKYSQKGRVQKWLREQIAQYQFDAQNHEDSGVRQISQWSADAVQTILDDLA